jgi:hypothetical protein
MAVQPKKLAPVRVKTTPVSIPTTKTVMFKKPTTKPAKATVQPHPRMRRSMKRTIDSDLETNWIHEDTRALYDNALPELSSQVKKLKKYL